MKKPHRDAVPVSMGPSGPEFQLPDCYELYQTEAATKVLLCLIRDGVAITDVELVAPKIGDYYGTYFVWTLTVTSKKQRSIHFSQGGHCRYVDVTIRNRKVGCLSIDEWVAQPNKLRDQLARWAEYELSLFNSALRQLNCQINCVVEPLQVQSRKSNVAEELP